MSDTAKRLIEANRSGIGCPHERALGYLIDRIAGMAYVNSFVLREAVIEAVEIVEHR